MIMDCREIYFSNYRVYKLIVFFFFSSRRRHTRWTGDWSSHVCSSDLAGGLYCVGPTRTHILSPIAGRRARRAGCVTVPPLLCRQAQPLPVTGRSADTYGSRRSSEIGRASCRERGELCVIGRL